MPNRLGMRNIRALPNEVPNDGGAVSIQFEARASEADATATVRYAVAAGFPFQVTGGDTANPDVTTTERTISQAVTITRTNAATVSFVQMEVIGSIPGDVNQKHTCFVWISGTVGEHVRTFREENGLTQGAFAEILGVSASTLSRIESGHFPSATLERALVNELKRAFTKETS